MKAVRHLGQAVLEVRREEELELQRLLSQVSPRGAFLRSAVLPGWGQRYQGARNRGYMMFALAAASIGTAVWAEGVYLDARQAYKTAPDGMSRTECSW